MWKKRISILVMFINTVQQAFRWESERKNLQEPNRLFSDSDFGWNSRILGIFRLNKSRIKLSRPLRLNTALPRDEPRRSWRPYLTQEKSRYYLRLQQYYQRMPKFWFLEETSDEETKACECRWGRCWPVEALWVVEVEHTILERYLRESW